MDIMMQIFLAVLFLVVAFLLYLAFDVAQKKRAVEVSGGATAEVTEKHIEREIKENLGETLKGNSRQVGVVAKKLSQYVTKEVERKTLEKTAVLKEHYERVVQEKDKSLNLAIQEVKVAGLRYQELDHSFRELGEEKKQTENVVHSMAEGVIMVNKKGEVLLMNPAAEKLLGVKKESKIGQSILSDLKEEQLISMVQQPADGTKNKEVVIQSHNDQVKKVLLASNAVIESEDGKTVGFVSVISDVTKQKEIEALKNEFLANVSHDLRTPLTCIRGSIQLLSETAESPLTPSQEKNISMALRNIDRLSRLINDLLDLSKLEEKKFTIKPVLFHADDLAQSLVSEFGAWSKTKGITFQLNVEKPLEIEADQDRIGQVLTNLIGNALKFTPNGGTITLVGRHTSDLQKVELGVRDTGPGIAEKDFKRLFEKFSRIESRAVQGISGTGLGLSIAKEIVALHGGRIWVESQEGKGSYFVFELPVKSIVAGPPAQ